jgi:transcriptional regulator with XRE-family HTH domain
MKSGEHFGSWLQHRLDLKRMRQADLARATGTSTGLISHWIQGSRRPTPESVVQICRALDASVEEAFRALGWFDEPTADTPAQADLIATIRRRNINDVTARAMIAMIGHMEPSE